jgi:hypothetical protein
LQRTVEVFTGAYASGKSETAINRALQSVQKQEKITLVDLDTVEPAYCLRPLVPKLEKMGVNVIAQTDYFGLGEAGSYVTPKQLNCLLESGNIIIDVGYGASGLDILDVIVGIDEEKDLRIYLVVNTAKFETSNVENILEYIEFASGLNKKPWKKFSGFVSNTHLGDETTKEDIVRGYDILKEVSEKTSIPIVAIGAEESLKDQLGESYDNVPVWYYKRMMPEAFW